MCVVFSLSVGCSSFPINLCWFNEGPFSITTGQINGFLLCVSSSSLPFAWDGPFWARWCNVLITSSLCPSGWWESKTKYRSVFLYICSKLQCGGFHPSRCTLHSPEMATYLLVSSLVNLNLLSTELICSVKFSTSWVLMWTLMPSTVLWLDLLYFLLNNDLDMRWENIHDLHSSLFQVSQT